MKKAICFFFVMLLHCPVKLLADDVQMYGVDDKDKGKGSRTEIPTPRVQADENTVEITCDSLVANAEVTITDFNGTVMHRSSETLSPANTLLFVTDNPSQPKYYIEIVADEQVFYGYF